MVISIPTTEFRHYIWSGKAVRINRRYSIGYTGSGYAKKPRLRLTNEYRDFVTDMAVTFAAQHRAEPIQGPVAVFLGFSLARRGKDADTDAYNKQVLDALEDAMVIDNDNQVISQSAMNAGGDKEGSQDLFTVIVMKLDGEVNIST